MRVGTKRKSSSKSTTPLYIVLFVIIVALGCEIDTTPPDVLSVYPGENASDVDLDVTISATFSEAIDRATLNSGSFSVESENGVQISGAVSYRDQENKAVFTPQKQLLPSIRYTATIGRGVSDQAGNRLGGTYQWSFTTRGIAHIDNQQDNDGNLYIDNQLTTPVYLYLVEGGVTTLIKEIPEYQQNNNLFLVHIPNPSGTAKTLKIWKKTDVSNPATPDESLLYVRWDVVIPTSTAEADRFSWVVKEKTGNTVSGTFFFSYPELGVDNLPIIYSVDVFVNSKTGAKITSLSPGTVDKAVGLEYGTYVLYYRYWYDDPYDAEGAEEIGWVEADADGNMIMKVLNNSKPEIYVDIPGLYGKDSGRWGSVEIFNGTDGYIQIYANGGLIENIDISPTAAESIIYSNESTEFSIPQGKYTLRAETYGAGQAKVAGQINDCYINEKYPFVWNVDATTTETKAITITNSTDKQLTIHNHETGEYLGWAVEGNASKTISVPVSVTSLRVWDEIGVLGNYQESVTDSWQIQELIALNDYPEVVIQYPRDGSRINTLTPTIDWESLKEVESYRVQVSDNQDFATTIIDESGIIESDYTIGSSLTEGTIYYWRLRERRSDDTLSEWSYGFSFTPDLTPPAAPVVSGTTPTGDTTPVWTWTVASDVVDTRYQLGSEASGGWTQSGGAGVLSYESETVLSEGYHTLYVQARDEAGNWSDSGSFTVELQPGGDTSLQVEIYMPDDPGITFTGQEVYLDSGQNMTVTTSATGVSGPFTWYLDGSVLSNETTDTVIVGSSLGLGTHWLMVVVEDGEYLFSETITFTVISGQ